MGNQDDGDLSRLSAMVIQAASQRGLFLATAESCTAGALAQILARAPGASDVLHGGFIVYTKANKTAALGVPQLLLSRVSAVHAEVARLMASGALARCPADIVVSITGVAGPDPDEDDNPVGLVYLAAACRDGRLFHEEHRFPDNVTPDEICAATLQRALLLFQKGITETA
jgi:nicotinamide-nucleotide amidase